MKSRTYTVRAVATIVPVITITRKSESRVVAMTMKNFLRTVRKMFFFFFFFGFFFVRAVCGAVL